MNWAEGGLFRSCEQEEKSHSGVLNEAVLLDISFLISKISVSMYVKREACHKNEQVSKYILSYLYYLKPTRFSPPCMSSPCALISSATAFRK